MRRGGLLTPDVDLHVNSSPLIYSTYDSTFNLVSRSLATSVYLYCYL